MGRLEIYLFGSFHVTIDNRPLIDFESDKARALLAYLAVEEDRPHRREALAGLLWSDTPERIARTNLRSALANLRQVLQDHQAQQPFLEVTRQTIQFNRASDAWVDVVWEPQWGPHLISQEGRSILGIDDDAGSEE